MIEIISIVFFSYISGSIPFGLILTKIFKKQDLRTIGSGNIGATNVLSIICTNSILRALISSLA